MPCPFCDRLASQDFTFENDLAAAFPDGFPVSRGHHLVIPKRHEADFFQLTLDEQTAMLVLANDVQAKLAETEAPDGFNLGVNVRAAAGQTVFHAHLHVIPRYAGDVAEPRGGVRGVIPGKQGYQGRRDWESFRNKRHFAGRADSADARSGVLYGDLQVRRLACALGCLF
jgi:diadenosine tetraphosphate (Ap4A) HIT family hydrolase